MDTKSEVEVINNPYLGTCVCKVCKNRILEFRRVRVTYKDGRTITKLLCNNCRSIFELIVD